MGTPVVDIHNHYTPLEVVEEARRGSAFDGVRIERQDGQEWMVHRQGFRYPMPPAFYDVEARLASMDALGIDVAVVSMNVQLYFYWADASGAADFARRANDATARFCAQSDGRLYGTATLPMQDPDAAVAELERAVTELGLVGAEIGPQIEDTPLDDASVRPVLEAAQRLNAPLILHPYYVGPRPGLEDFYLTNLVGNPLSTTVCAARLILSGTLDALDGLEVVLMHGGGYLPYQIGRLDHGFRVRPEAKRPSAPPSSYLRRFTYDTITHRAEALDYLARTVGPERVAYGTDFPFDMAGGSFADQTAGAGFDQRAQELVAGVNATRLFGLRLGAPA
jgi:aminocarboxymuconate-semialdehyde decarboxylase